MNGDHVTPTQARELLDNQGYVYLDVRTVEEFEEGRPPGALNIPLAQLNRRSGRMEMNPEFLRVVGGRIPKNAKLIVGCQAGGRSAQAQQMLRAVGYAQVINMSGGFGGATDPYGTILEPGWSTLGFPIERGDAGQRSYHILQQHDQSK